MSMQKTQKISGIKGFIYNLMTSGSLDRLDLIPRYQLIFANAVGVLGMVILFFFSFSSFSKGSSIIGLSTLITGTSIFIVFLLTRFLKSYVFMRYFFALILFVLFLFLTYTGGTEGSGVFWALSYPIMALFLLGTRIGTLVAYLFWGLTAVILFSPSLNKMSFSNLYVMRYLGSYITIWIFAFFYQMTMERTQRQLQKTSLVLAREKQQTDSIMNYVEQGLFLLEQDGTIGQSCSRSLQNLLMLEKPQGKKLMTILEPHLSSQDFKASSDYLEMHYRDDINPELLKEINPLEEVCIKNQKNSDEKILRFGFGRIPHESGKPGILGFVADITEEFRLQEQLKKEEANYSRNMEHLFQIIHIHPSMMEDFLHQADMDMKQINHLLKEDSSDKRNILTKVFQLLHSMKGNALLMGLKALGERIHLIEERVRFAMDHQPTWDDFLDITLDLGNLQTEQKEIAELVTRIKQFSLEATPIDTETKPQEDPLIEALHQMLNAEAREQKKQVILNTDHFHMDYFPEDFKPFIKDITIQLMRNSLSHGIETPEIRHRNCKEKSGMIELITERKNNTLIYHFKDDGQGINTRLIKEQALQSNLKEKEELNQMQGHELVSLIFHPGFSTRDSSDLSAGRGMGMNVIKEKTQQLGGRMKLSSKPGHFSCFSFHFPLNR